MQDKKNQQKIKLAKTKEENDELNANHHHHWWSEADRMSQKLQLAHGSAFWHITRLLAKLKWFFFLPVRLIHWLGQHVKHLFRWLLLHAMAYARLRPALSMRAARALRGFPRLDARVRRLAQAGSPPPSMGLPPEVAIPRAAILDNKTVEFSEKLSRYSLRTRRIYAGFKVVVDEQHDLESR